jgi:hypothetical protein
MWQLTIAGLVLNFLGTVAVGFVVPRYSVNLVTETGPASRAVGIVGRIAQHGGWAAMAAGFVLQALGVTVTFR